MTDNGIKIISKNGRRLGQHSVIDYEQMLVMKYKEGKSAEEIADHFGVTTQAVYQALKRVKTESIAQVWSRGESFIDKQITTQTVLIGLLHDASELLNDLREAIDPDEWDKIGIEKRKLHLQTMGEIRQQIDQVTRLQEKIYSVEAMQEFEQIVMETIEEASTEVAQKIKDRLKRRQPTRQFIGEAGRNR